jgi:hypothetical protein
LFYHHQQQQQQQQQQLAGFHGIICSIPINKFFGQPVTVSNFCESKKSGGVLTFLLET